MGQRTKLLLISILVVAGVSVSVEAVSVATFHRALLAPHQSDSGAAGSMELAELRAALVRAGLQTAVATVVIALVGVLALIRLAKPLLDRIEQVDNAAHEALAQRVAERTAELESSFLALRQSEEQVRILLDSTAEAIYGIDLEGCCTFANPACVRLLGYPSDMELLGRNMHALIHHTRADGAPHPQEACQIYAAFQQGEGTHSDREVLWRADGTSFPVEYWSYPIQRQGQATGAVVTFLDITERHRAAAEVRRERDFADAVINSLPGVFYVFDTEGGFLRWNQNVEKITGYTADELAGLTPLDFVPEADRPEVVAAMQEVFEKGVSTIYTDYVFKDGSSRPYLFTGIRFEAEDRQLLIGIGIDVSEQQNAEAKLRQHAKRLEVISEIMEAVLAARSTEQIAQAVLDRLADLVPYERSSVVLFDQELTKATLLAIHGAPGTLLRPGMEMPLQLFGSIESLQEGRTHRVDDLECEASLSAIQQNLVAEGVRAYINVPLCFEDELLGTLNITTREPGRFTDEDLLVAAEVAKPLAVGIRQAQLHEQVLRHSDQLELHVKERTSELVDAEARFRSVVEAMPNALVMSDPNGVIRLMNAQAEALFGYARDDLVGQPVELLVPEDRRAAHPGLRAGYVANPHARAMGAGRDLTARCRDGREVPVEIGLNPLSIEGQTFVLASIVDITERTVAEAALRESEGRFRELFENANDLIQAVTPEGRFVYVNPAWCETMGYHADEIESLTILDIIDPVCLDHCMQLFRQVVSGENITNIDATFRAKDGTQIQVEGNASCQFDDNGKPIMTRSIFRNVTQRKQAEEARRDGVILGQLRYDIHVALATRGSLHEVLQVCAQSIVDRLDAAFARVWTLNEDEQVLELQASAGLYTHLDGPHGRIPVGKFKIGLIAAERQPHLTNSVVGDERISDQEWAQREGMVAFAGYPLIADGRVIGVIAMFARHLLNENTLQAMANISQGIALGIERIRAEEQLAIAKEEAEAADRVKSAFLATMSHELRTPLNSIIGFTGIMTKGLTGPLNDEQNRQLGMVQGSARHLLSLINDVLDISKIEAGQFEIESKPFDLHEAIEVAIKSVAPAAAQKDLTLRSELGPGIGNVIGDRRRVEQVLLNLVNNAVKFTESGEVRIYCEVTEKSVVTHVADTGCGIKPENLDKLFQAFQQLDAGIARQHEGTGLGLVICKRLVELMGGEISVKSSWNQGSTFSFTLPLGATASGTHSHQRADH